MLRHSFRVVMPWLATFALLASLSRAGHAGEASPTLLLRSPAVSAHHIAFAYANNIWVVTRAGGHSQRLTTFQGLASNPRFSPDGEWIAFSGEYAGNLDVYVVNAAGGEPKRLTWHPGADAAQGWTPDGKRVVFASSRATWAPNAAPRFWTVPASGGVEEPMALPRAFQGKISPDGAHVAYRLNNSWDDERRNYRGGQNRPVWIADLKTLDVVSPPWTDSKDIDPVWLGQTVYFLSDRDGVSNVWSYELASKKLAQLTKFTDYDIKTLESGAGVLVFEQAGRVHELDPATGRSRAIDITVTGDFPWMMARWQEVGSLIENIALSPTGKRALVEARGEIFTIPGEKGDTRNLTRSSGAAERDPAWSPDGKWVSYFSDRSGEYQLVLEDPSGIKPVREIALPNPNHYYTPSWSPDSKKLLYHDTDLKVWVLDVASGNTKIVGEDPWMVPRRTLVPTWSPDSRWIAYSSHLNTLFRAIFVVNVETGARHQVTDGLADASYPVWDANGKHLWFAASTDVGLASQWLDMTGFPIDVTASLYAAVLTKGESSPWLPESDEDAGLASGGKDSATSAKTNEKASSKTSAAPAKPAAVPVNIDFEGLQSRIIAVPGVPPGAYSDLKVGTAGTLFYLEMPLDAKPGVRALHRYKVSDRKTIPFVSELAEYTVSADGQKLLYQSAGAPAGTTASLFLVDADKSPPTAGSGKLSVSLKMLLEPREEFAQIFNEGWRNQRDYLYVENSHGSDWPKMRQMYGRFLPHVNHRADLNYLLDNMGAELAIGHSYVRGGDLPEVPKVEGGLLGADYTIESNRYRITRIYDHESWNPDLKAPLAAVGVNVSVGDYVLAVNGVELLAPDNIHRLLDGCASRQTVLTVNSRPSLEGSRQVTVVPVGNEQTLRTRAWVESNRRTVDKLSGGRLAYVFVPNTGVPGFTSFNRYYFSQQDRAGVIIDERYNGGGSAADYMIEVMQRTFDGYFNNVAGERVPFTSPSAGIWGPKVMIVNEMAGSGGDLLPYMFRNRKLGTIVGKRTWGGLVHTADTPQFIDGGSMIAPRGGFFTTDGRWAVENEGVAPDIDVENWPKDVNAGRDAQLERAVAEALKQLEATPVKRSMKEPAAPTTGKRK